MRPKQRLAGTVHLLSPTLQPRVDVAARIEGVLAQARLGYHSLNPRKLLEAITAVFETDRLEERTHVQPTRALVRRLKVREPFVEGKDRDGSRMGCALEDSVEEIPVRVVACRAGAPSLSVPPGPVPPGPSHQAPAARPVEVLYA